MKLTKDQENSWILLLGGVALGSLLGILVLLWSRMNLRRQQLSRREGEDYPTAPGRVRIVPFRSEKEEPPVHHPERKWGGGTRDVVDEASWESFPASDPPAW